MTNIAHIADMAVLAEAAYANLLLENNVYDELQNTDFGAGQSFSSTQAAEFVTKWVVIDYGDNCGLSPVFLKVGLSNWRNFFVRFKASTREVMEKYYGMPEE